MNNTEQAPTNKDPANQTSAAHSAVIEVSNLSKCFGDFTAVDKLNMRIEKACVHGFLGPNGSGKTTAIRMMCGLIEKTSGQVSVLGLSIDENAEAIREQVGYMTQRFSLYQDMTVRENLLFLSEIRGLNKQQRVKRVSDVLDEFNLADIPKRLAGDLSGGQKRRLALAAAMLTEPRLLILDEPTSEVDPNTRRDMWEIFFKLAAQGTTILVSTHLMDEAERCHNLTILNEGVKVADGTTQALKDDFKHNVIVVEGAEVSWLSVQLKALASVLSVAQSGLLLRVLVQANIKMPIDYIQDAVGGDYKVSHVLPSIEDVFVAATHVSVNNNVSEQDE